MKSIKSTMPNMSFIENPRSIDRLNAVCSVLLGTMLIVLTYLAIQPSMNPQTNGGVISIEIEAPAAASYQPSAPADMSQASTEIQTTSGLS